MGYISTGSVKLSAVSIDVDLVMGAHNITLGAGQTVDGEDVSAIKDNVIIAELTNAIVEAATPTGNADSPENINVDNTSTSDFDAIDKYVEIDFGKVYLFDSMRMKNYDTNHEDNGHFKIAYWNGVSWVDWETGIATKHVNSFDAWSTSTLVMARLIRIVCTAVDTRGGFPDRSECVCVQLKRT